MNRNFSRNQVVVIAVVMLAIASMLFVLYNPRASVSISFGLDGLRFQITGGQFELPL